MTLLVRNANHFEAGWLLVHFQFFLRQTELLGNGRDESIIRDMRAVLFQLRRVTSHFGECVAPH
ncbi:MAG: hypothetical protein GY805_17335 [Chloroflexi bacterium]|nr:hypothetical protein [Chloroflexota bacterium]